MKYTIKIASIDTINEIHNNWSNDEIIELLELFNFPDAVNSSPSELKDLLFMAINDFEPQEAAEIILNYKLSDILSKGQIHQISNEMIEDKIAEEYPNISLHYILFNINQLLYKAYNGIFPNTKASLIQIEITCDKQNTPLNKEMVLKIISKGLNAQNIIVRLFEDQLKPGIKFPEANNIIWELFQNSSSHYTLVTSDYWINKDDFIEYEFIAQIDHAEDGM